jgi:hypothetical protein
VLFTREKYPSRASEYLYVSGGLFFGKLFEYRTAKLAFAANPWNKAVYKKSVPFFNLPAGSDPGGPHLLLYLVPVMLTAELA